MSGSHDGPRGRQPGRRPEPPADPYDGPRYADPAAGAWPADPQAQPYDPYHREQPVDVTGPYVDPADVHGYWQGQAGVPAHDPAYDVDAVPRTGPAAYLPHPHAHSHGHQPLEPPASRAVHQQRAPHSEPGPTQAAPPPSVRVPTTTPTLSTEGYSSPRAAPVQSEPARNAIVPAGSVTGRSLTLVIAIMCFFACLTAGTVYMMNQTAAAWLREVASEITVQVEARPTNKDVDRTVQEVARFLEQQPGVRSVKPLSRAENASLLEGWLGQTDSLASMPVPRLIALEINTAAPPDLAVLRGALAGRFRAEGVVLDDHRHWQNQIRTVTRSFALGGLAILMLVGAATTAIIVSATRSALASNREIVEVLHFVGATDRFIAREFEKHFLRLGIRAGIVGAVCAVAVFLGLPTVMELLGGGSVTIAEVKRLVGGGSLDVSGYVLLDVVVVVIAALCMLTSRIGVYRILHSQQ
jgi:cell division transport system permease protein